MVSWWSELTLQKVHWEQMKTLQIPQASQSKWCWRPCKYNDCIYKWTSVWTPNTGFKFPTVLSSFFSMSQTGLWLADEHCMVISLVFFVHCLVRMLLDKLLELLDVSKNGIRPFLPSVIALWHQFPVLNSLLYMNVPYLNSFPQIPILKQKRGGKTYPKLYLANTSPGNYPKLWIPTKDVNIYLLFMCI